MKALRASLKELFFASALGFASSALAGPTLWIGDGLGNLGTVDVTTGAQTVIGSMGRTMTDIAFDPTGNLYGITTSELYKINTSDGTSTLVGSLGTPGSGSFNSLVFDDSGVLYAAAGGGLYRVNPTTGAITATPGSSCISGLCMNSSGDLAFVGGKLYLTSDHSGPDSLWQVSTTFMNSGNTYPVNYGFGSIDIRTGSTTYSSVFGLASPDHAVLYGVDGTRILQINTSNATATVLSDYYSPVGLGAAFGAAFYSEAGAVLAPINPVPEPETYAMLIAGLGLLGFAARRRKQKEAAAA
jgi:hypothetical protein